MASVRSGTLGPSLPTLSPIAGVGMAASARPDLEPSVPLLHQKLRQTVSQTPTLWRSSAVGDRSEPSPPTPDGVAARLLCECCPGVG